MRIRFPVIITLLVVWSLLGFSECAVALYAVEESNLHAALKRLDTYSADLLAFAEANRDNSLEYEIASDLDSQASLASAYVESAETLLDLYQTLSCSSDRAKAADTIRETFADYAKRLAYLAKQAQNGVAHTKVPGLAVTGGKLRDGLRQLSNVFERGAAIDPLPPSKHFDRDAPPAGR